MTDQQRRDSIAQWVFDTKTILGRFSLWLEDLEQRWVTGEPTLEHSFVGPSLEQAFITTSAVTALGTRLFGRYGEGKGQPKAVINTIKKDADAQSAYALSEGLWFLTRNLPENHAVMVSLGEGLMPKAGETPEMGSNPLLGFGRVYARPQVARFLDRLVRKMLNEPGYSFEDFWQETRHAGITVWGAAIDTLENTSRFASGAATGPMAVLHLFDQPIMVSRPYEAYMGNLTLPRKVVDTAADRSILINFRTPRKLVLEAIKLAYPGIRPEEVHVWTLRGSSREARIGELWQEWKGLGVHLVEDGWALPTGGEAFTSSGTYAPTYLVGEHPDGEGRTHLFICDGYAASAEALQAASLDPILGLRTALCIFSSKFAASYRREQDIMCLTPSAADFSARLGAILGKELTSAEVDGYKAIVQNARDAGMPLDRRNVTIDDFFPQKHWRVLAIASYMLSDPYTGASGVAEVEPGIYRVTSRAATEKGILEVVLTLRLVKPIEEMRHVFSPLLDRFYAGQDYKNRPVKISDSGRIRNELQTLASEAIHYGPDGRMSVAFDRIDDAVLAPDKRELIREVLRWYKQSHPIWFRWLVAD